MSSTLETPQERPALLLSGIDSLYVGYYVDTQSRHRHRILRRGHRSRAVRGRHRACAADWQGAGHHRRRQPGPQDGAGADLRRRARCRDRAGAGDDRGHRRLSARHWHDRQPRRGDGRSLGARRRRAGAGEGAEGRRAAARGERERSCARGRLRSCERRAGDARLARGLAGAPAIPMPGGIEPGLEATAYFNVAKSAYASGTNIAEVDVDAGTGEVRVVRYSVAHDCGRLINPLTVDGQIEGGVVHGIGNALFEEMRFDDNAQPVMTNYGEYLLPASGEMPRIDIVHVETPSPLNPLGVKGAGEGGTIPAAAAVVAAVEDALREFDVTVSEHPLTPERVLELIGALSADAG